jgi:hypothetical protein
MVWGRLVIIFVNKGAYMSLKMSLLLLRSQRLWVILDKLYVFSTIFLLPYIHERGKDNIISRKATYSSVRPHMHPNPK